MREKAVSRGPSVLTFPGQIYPSVSPIGHRSLTNPLLMSVFPFDQEARLVAVLVSSSKCRGCR